MSELAARFNNLFKGLNRAYTIFRNGKKNITKNKIEGSVRTIRGPVTSDLWSEHLEGKKSIGVVPITDEGISYFGCIDIDIYDAQIWKTIDEKITKYKLPLIPCLTKSGGLHLYTFSKDGVSAKLLRSTLMQWAVLLGYSDTEIFPKQIELASEHDTGNAINMPYYKGDETDRFALAGEKKLLAKDFLHLAEKINTTEKLLKSIKIPVNKDFEGAPPCLSVLATKGFPEGSRNSGLFSVGVYLKKRFADEYETKLEEYNRQYFNPPLAASEVLAVVKSLKKKEYFYKCKDQPLCNNCNKEICYDTKFGIERKSEGEIGVVLGQLTKIDTQPPLWKIDVDGSPVELQETEDLLSQSRFKVLCFNKINKLIYTVKHPQWDDHIRKCLDNLVILEAPEDADEKGIFKFHLENYIASVSHTDKKEDLERGRIFADQDTLVFKGPNLGSYLRNKNYFSPPRVIWNSIRELGGKTEKLRVNGRVTSVWRLPTKAIELPERFKPTTLPEGEL